VKKKCGDCQGQRLFRFKSSVLQFKSEKLGISCDQGNMDHYESWSEKSGSRSSRKSGKARHLGKDSGAGQCLGKMNA
jgi:hypothetical protein